MTQYERLSSRPPSDITAADWVVTLARYRDPNAWRSGFELGVTIIPFLSLWVLAWMALGISYPLAITISLMNAAFLLRLFAIQHDCGHGSFLRQRAVSDWLGRFLGVLTLTPYDVWRRSHAIHHAGSGNLARRGIGDIVTLTVTEYNARTPFGRWTYRLYRHPLTLFGLAPAYLFLLQNRLPLGFMSHSRYWLSAMGTNVAILGALGLIWTFGGLMPILLIFLPTTLLAATAGMWLFYIQHQFEDTHWRKDRDWRIHDAALHGSSHYILPQPLQWISANIGIHHVHHLYSRIPFYRLTEVIRDHKPLARANRLTLRDSLGCTRLNLWDEDSGKLLSFSQARSGGT